MTDQLEPPKFLQSYWKAVGRSIDKRGVWALVPGWLLASAVIGAVPTYYMRAEFWSQEKLDVSLIVYTGVLTLNGLILTLSWNAFAKMYESISASGFASYLMMRGRMDGYTVFIDYVNYAQVAAILCSATALLVLLCHVHVIYDRIAFAVMLTASLYAIKKASGAVTAMRQLVWQKAIFDDAMARERGENVIPFDRNTSES
jgi:hypothetical protein